MLKVNEVFETIQGEGVYTGVPSIFLRLQGCPVGCAWCDTKHTWEIDLEQQTSFETVKQKQTDGEQWCQVTEEEVVKVCKSQYMARHVVITGGEPCMYDLSQLTETLESEGFSCQIETSGTFEVKASEKTWVTVSPKVGMKGGLTMKAQAMLRANEIKHPVGTQKDIDNLNDLLSSFTTQENIVVALQPISQKQRATQLCIDTCIQNNWRLSIQTHKYLSIA
ncbi:7-carboxy-7-deazaguanine synthase QueE [Vibrio brasiliensis]|uniref:7-carboxy-7-deazaguanine synthase QueE n=1 Tax=Vibrio brasiliensis TaxID=170652 RepID=UPI001EFD8CFA|nr:7-carboxy-7-deazaguanine synthase QueE [Vibrio brasiliensis]MCG9751341.1 7-carboxy-7-deazaguanine synthase QueE [Vibrio brasiliensis]